jgi:hypothetical protein
MVEDGHQPLPRLPVPQPRPGPVGRPTQPGRQPARIRIHLTQRGHEPCQHLRVTVVVAGGPRSCAGASFSQRKGRSLEGAKMADESLFRFRSERDTQAARVDQLSANATERADRHDRLSTVQPAQQRPVRGHGRRQRRTRSRRNRSPRVAVGSPRQRRRDHWAGTPASPRLGRQWGRYRVRP